MFEWSATGRNHCSTTLSAGDIGDLINNHAMPDLRGRNAACAIYTIDNSGTFGGTLKAAVCDDLKCYSTCWNS